MTDRPYTDADLRAEAARQLAAAVEGDDFSYLFADEDEDDDFRRVGERMTNETIASRATWSSRAWWHSLKDEGEGDHFEQAQRAIHDLIRGAADVSAWAVALGAAGLKPGPDRAWYCHGDYDVAVQIALSERMTDEARAALTPEIWAAVDATVCRVLSRQIVLTTP